MAKEYGYKFSDSVIGRSLRHLLQNSNAKTNREKRKDYQKHLNIVKSNPSASFLELRLFFAHLSQDDKVEKVFVINVMKSLNYPLSKRFIAQNKHLVKNHKN